MQNKKAIIYLFLGNFLSGIAQGISMIAVPAYIAIELGLSQFLLQLYFLVAFVSLFWSFLAGVLIDRWRREKILLIESVSGAIVLLSVALFGISSGGLSATAVAIVYAFTFFLYALHYPNLYAFMQEIVEPKHHTKVTSWLEVIGQFTTLGAGALAAILLSSEGGQILNLFGYRFESSFSIPQLSISQIFLIDGVSYVLAGIIYLQIRYQSFRQKDSLKHGMFTEFKEGIAFLRERMQVWFFGLSSYLVFISVLLISFSLLPIYIRQILQEGSGVYASAEMYFAFGSLCAGIFARRFFGSRGLILPVIILCLSGTFSIFALSLQPSLLLFYAMLFLLGFSNAGIRIFRISYLFARIPTHMMGRAGTVISNTGMLLRVILAGIFILPFFSNGDNIIFPIYILSGLSFLGALWIIFNYNALRLPKKD